jgi:carboxyl-terminal processing protease
MGNPVVSIEGLPAINLLCPTTGNNVNNALGAVLVPSVTNVFLTYAAPSRVEPPASASPAPGAADAPSPVALDAAALARFVQSLGPANAPGAEVLLPGGVAYLAIPVFSSGVPAGVYSAVRRLRARGMEALLIDVRDNPGGELTSALELLGDFLDPGSLLATLTDADGDETLHRSQQEQPFRFPLIVLVNRRTASAAEIFAGCLQAHGRALIVGEVTYGKGIGQMVLPEPHGRGAHYVTVARITLPGGRVLDGVGVHPDIALEPSPAEEERSSAHDTIADLP